MMTEPPVLMNYRSKKWPLSATHSCLAPLRQRTLSLTSEGSKRYAYRTPGGSTSFHAPNIFVSTRPSCDMEEEDEQDTRDGGRSHAILGGAALWWPRDGEEESCDGEEMHQHITNKYTGDIDPQIDRIDNKLHN